MKKEYVSANVKDSIPSSGIMKRKGKWQSKIARQRAQAALTPNPNKAEAKKERNIIQRTGGYSEVLKTLRNKRNYKGHNVGSKGQRLISYF